LDNIHGWIRLFWIIINNILQDPAIPQSDGEHDYAYNWCLQSEVCIDLFSFISLSPHNLWLERVLLLNGIHIWLDNDVVIFSLIWKITENCRVTSLTDFCFLASFWRYFILCDMQRTNFLRHICIMI
jgi:hypothetical protein